MKQLLRTLAVSAVAVLAVTACTAEPVQVVWIADDLKYDNNGRPYVECEQQSWREGSERHVWVEQAVADRFDDEWAERPCPRGAIKADNVPDGDPGSGAKRRESKKKSAPATTTSPASPSTPKSAPRPTVRTTRTS